MLPANTCLQKNQNLCTKNVTHTRVNTVSTSRHRQTQQPVKNPVLIVQY